MAEASARLPRIITRSDALDRGLSTREIRAHVRTRLWVPLDTGTYLTRVEEHPDPFVAERDLHIDRCVAGARRHEGSALAFGSCAVARGLPLVSGVPRLGQLIVTAGGWTGIRNGVRYRAMQVEPDHLTDLDVHGDGTTVRATTAARTLADVARTMSPADAMAAGDAALRAGMTTADEVLRILTGMRHVRGCRTAVPVVDLWDPRRETALESWSALRFWQWGLPDPTPQVDFYDEEGFIGRVDFFWEDFGVIGEADGRSKYSEPGVLYAEKRREDRLRRARGCRDLIRWGWEDLRSPKDRALRDQLTAALMRHQR
jgi:hypothetical protein